MRRPRYHAHRLIRDQKIHHDQEGRRDQELARPLALGRRRVHPDWVRHGRDRDLAFDRAPDGLAEAALSPGWVGARLARRDPYRCST